MTIESIVLIALIVLLTFAVFISYRLLKQPLKAEEETKDSDQARQLLMRRRAIVECDSAITSAVEHTKWLDSVREYYKKSQKTSD